MVVHPGTIITTVCDILRASADLVSTELLGENSYVIGYYDSVPNQEDLEKAILNNATHPFVLVCYMGFVPGLGRSSYETMRHKFMIVWRGRETTAPESSAFNILYAIENATGSDGQTFRHTQFAGEDCLTIGTDMTAKRLPKFGGVSDLWAIEFFLTENGG